MKPGNVVEYIDKQKIVCATILDRQKNKLRLLTENRREVKMAASRIVHCSSRVLDFSLGKDRLVATLIDIGKNRQQQACRFDVKEMWDILHTEQKWIELSVIAGLFFSDGYTPDDEAVVIRALFNNRIYFKFDSRRFFPFTKEQVDKTIVVARKSKERQELLQNGSKWLRKICKNGSEGQPVSLSTDQQKIIDILKNYYLSGKESDQYNFSREILSKSGINSEAELFRVLTSLGIWKEDQNLDIERMGVPTEFSNGTHEYADQMVKRSLCVRPATGQREDFTHLPAITIDGQNTLDFDDAISLENLGDHYRLGIHIVDVGHYVKKGDPLDVEALTRGSSIYMPDMKIPMLPPSLAEGLCSLKEGNPRPAISVMIDMDRFFEIADVAILSSLILVKEQLTYYDVNMAAEGSETFQTLMEIAGCFRNRRLEAGAVQITLPETHVWLDGEGSIHVNRVNRESPGRMLISELMIMANWLMARFLSAKELPAVFRSQASPRERLFRGQEGTLFQNWMQRKHLCRFLLGTKPDKHAGLGLECYTTATSPIRKGFDLITQRQIRAALGQEDPYSQEEMATIIERLEEPMRRVSRVQFQRNRYWILKHLESMVGWKEEAIVLYKKRNTYQILIPHIMIECDLPQSGGRDLKPEELIQVTIQHVDARRDMFSVFSA